MIHVIIQTIQDLLKKARQGKSVDEDDIPPAVAVTTTKRPQPLPPTGILRWIMIKGI